MATKKNEQIIEVKPLEIEEVEIRITGNTPLIVHAWSEKAKKEMLDKQTGATRVKKRTPKNPVEDFINSMYWISDKPTEYTIEAFERAIADGAKFGFPVTGIKQSAISGAFRGGMTKDKASIRGAFFINGIQVKGDLLAVIDSDPPVMREDMVRVGMGTADIRYRGEFNNWSTVLKLTYNKNGPYSLEQIINMINIGGYTVGIGEWRPEKDGQYGMFKVSTSE